MTGVEFARLVLALPREEQRLDLADLIELYDALAPSCHDCGGRHLTVHEALACDDFTDARHRRDAARTARAIELEHARQRRHRSRFTNRESRLAD